MNSELDSLSYAVGVDIARHYYESQQLDLDPAILHAGFKDVVEGAELKLAPKQIHTILLSHEKQLKQAYQEEMDRIARENEAIGREFLRKNKMEKGIVELQSGLQYRILKEGAGSPPEINDLVRVSFEGKLLDGNVFSPDGERDIAIVQAIPGLQEALTRMRPGDEWEIFVPAQLGWGKQGREMVEPNSLLIFKMQMKEIL